MLGSSNNHAAYNSFLDEQDPHYLGVAMEDSTVLSRLMFHWVNPLIKKGGENKLSHSDDLYDLPIDITCGTVSLKLQKALLGNIDKTIQQCTLHDSIRKTVSLKRIFLFSSHRFYEISKFVGEFTRDFFQQRQTTKRIAVESAASVFLVSVLHNRHLTIYFRLLRLRWTSAS